MPDGLAGSALITALLVLGVAVYLAPTILAVWRDDSRVRSVATLNVVLGWTFVGWVIALRMATAEEPLPPSRFFRAPGGYRPLGADPPTFARPEHGGRAAAPFGTPASPPDDVPAPSETHGDPGGGDDA